MDGIPLKFRGVKLDTQEIVYGNCLQYDLGDEYAWDIVDAEGVTHAVKDVVQLIGYDKNGDEVYYGDDVIIDGAYHSQVEAVLVFCRFLHYDTGNFVLEKGSE